MTFDQGVVFAVLAGTLVLFVAQVRYDVVALLALFALVAAGLVAPDAAFLGFADPAVITVAAVLGISRALLQSGTVDILLRVLTPLRGRPTAQILVQSGITAGISAFMNNVGALAIMMPVGLRAAYKEGYAPSRVLMPLAFCSLLGGLITLIGTPTNLIIAALRREASGAPFTMFAFTPVGLAVALAGLAYVGLVGWRLLPEARGGGAEELLDIGDYVVEARLPKDGRPVSVGGIEKLGGGEVTVVARYRDEQRVLAPYGHDMVRPGDIVLLEGPPETVNQILKTTGLALSTPEGSERRQFTNRTLAAMEVVIRPGSPLIGENAAALNLRAAHGVNVMAIARSGRRVTERMSRTTFRTGDVLLIQVAEAERAEVLRALRLLSLAERDQPLGRPQRAVRATAIFAVGIVCVMLGLAPVQIVFPAVALVLVLARTVSATDLYAAIDWPVLILIGALFPLATAMETTGATAWLVGGLRSAGEGMPPWVVIAGTILACMLVSEILANNATALLMGPLAIGAGQQLGVAIDAMLMAVAIGTSCTFLSPIGHQSNTLVLEPGGYRFLDYARMGAPLTLITLVVATPLILLVFGGAAPGP